MRKLFSVLLAALLLLAVPSMAFADATVAVNGNGEVLVSADLAIVSLGVSARDKEVLAAQAKVNETIAAVRAALIAGGVSEADINTDYINIYPVYNYSDDREELSAYNANSSLAVRVTAIEDVGRLIDAAFEAGANTLNGIQFMASDTSEAEAKALELAVEDAITKAEVLAGAAGMKIAGINAIQESSVYSWDRGAGYYNSKAESVEAAMDAAGTVVQSARLAVTATISVIFAVN